MSEFTKHSPGTFCWPELATTDPSGAKRFYSSLFGWGINDQPIGPDEVYTMFTFGGKELAAAHKLDTQRSAMGIPPHWLSYISTDNVDKALEDVKKLGGNVVA